MIQFETPLSTCVACGSTQIGPWATKSNRYGNFAISRCAKCQSGFLNPRPSLAWLLSAIYSQSGHGLSAPPELQSILRAEAEYPNATVDAQSLVQGALELLSVHANGSPRRALDVGSGYGFYSLAAARHGFQVTAINPAKWENAIFRQLLSGHTVELVEESFEAHAFRDTRFDLIIASQVLEHVHQPADFLRKLTDLLSPQGVLVVAVPNFDWLLVKLLRQRESGVLWLPEHLNYFTHRGLADLLQLSGLAVRKRSNVSRIPYTAISRRLHLHGTAAKTADGFMRISQWVPMRLTEAANVSLVIRVWAQRAQSARKGIR